MDKVRTQQIKSHSPLASLSSEEKGKNVGLGTFIFDNDQKKTRAFRKNITTSTVTSFQDFKDFFKIMQDIYHNNPYWVSPFWVEYKDFFKSHNPFWQHAEARLFLVHKDHKIVGRIAGIIDYLYCKTYKEKIGFFGFFECINDFRCANALMTSVREWLRSKKMTLMRGPINGRIDVGCGFLYTGFNSSPCVLSSYSPQYYLSFTKRLNMYKKRDQVVYYIDLTKPLPQQLQDRASECAASGVTIRPFNRLRVTRDLKIWIDLLRETFANHWGYIPVSDREITSRFGVKHLRWFGEASLFLFAEIHGEPIAYLWATPDYNQIFRSMKGHLGLAQILQFLGNKHHINMGKLHLIGIKKKFQNRHIGSYLNYSILTEMKKRGYVGAEVGWIDEKNTVAHKTIALTGAQVYKKFRVFDINITDT